LQHHLHDGHVLADAPTCNGTGRHAHFRAIERVPDALDERWPIEEIRIGHPIARLCAGMALLDASGQRAVRIYFDVLGLFDGYLHVHDTLLNRPMT
jgi:hypothetical protein